MTESKWKSKPYQKGIMRMLVDSDWLKRKIESEPDGLDCEAGLVKAANLIDVSKKLKSNPDHDAYADSILNEARESQADSKVKL